MAIGRREVLSGGVVGLLASLSGCANVGGDSQPTTVDLALTDTEASVVDAGERDVDCRPTTGGRLVAFKHLEGPPFPAEDLFLFYHDSESVHWFADCAGLSNEFSRGDTVVFDTPPNNGVAFGYDPNPAERRWTELGRISRSPTSSPGSNTADWSGRDGDPELS